ncbi:arginase family protein [Amycolatopsis mongoliensis]|uniref:Arginase family protein n=1 Tax=Amycolatopsis mongoliensis TaxID=715475 RepID=A0A9Y2K1D2_9PSEU|nr:arginase family protein [Amycolatopsis sp. 4-36]WIY06769.1 arginase family protein [Amycolatopsis sp. 4-36]
MAGEDLAIMTGRGAADLADIDGPRPYVRDADALVLGVRSAELTAAGIAHVTSEEMTASGVTGALERAASAFAGLDGFWVHVDIDVLDPAYVSAVDSPDPGGLSPAALVSLVRGLLALPGAAGFELTVFDRDPDLDPDGHQAAPVADLLERTFSR